MASRLSGNIAADTKVVLTRTSDFFLPSRRYAISHACNGCERLRYAQCTFKAYSKIVAVPPQLVNRTDASFGR